MYNFLGFRFYKMNTSLRDRKIVEWICLKTASLPFQVQQKQIPPSLSPLIIFKTIKIVFIYGCSKVSIFAGQKLFWITQLLHNIYYIFHLFFSGQIKSCFLRKLLFWKLTAFTVNIHFYINANNYKEDCWRNKSRVTTWGVLVCMAKVKIFSKKNCDTLGSCDTSGS